jgi:hypothetical protein
VNSPTDVATIIIPLTLSPEIAIPAQYYTLPETLASVMRGIAELRRGEGTYLDDSDLDDDSDA